MPSFSQTSHRRLTPSESDDMWPDMTRLTWASLAAS